MRQPIKSKICLNLEETYAVCRPDSLRSFASQYCPDLVLMDPAELDAAVVAIVFVGKELKPKACYDRVLLAKEFVSLNGWSREEAYEWIDYNCDCGGLWIYKQDVKLIRLNHIKISAK